ncbi:MAG: asparaginase [Saccharospirillaceae bacterium]|nr:asparaginase domain-containing protein [Pseudomonadales bacterium]NRB81452.1 asparaginase [Saccharospirillaceae bacterium]
MKPILILNLGGTICMCPSESGLIPDSQVLPDFLNKHHQRLNFVYKEPFELIDSSQANNVYWYQCAQYIMDNHNDYRGVIITHGTDTMAYFASSLRFYFASTSLPIIITGSQLPLTQDGNDAIANVQFAIKQIDDRLIQQMGIAIAFNNQLLQAEKTSKVDTQTFNGFAQNCTTAVLTQSISALTMMRELNIKNIQLIWIHPSFDFNQLPTPQSGLIYIFKSYGAGNLPKHPKLEDFLLKAIQKNAVVINHSQCFYSEVDMNIYAAGNWLGNYNVLGAKNMTMEALMAKLHCIDTDDIKKLKTLLLTPFHYELA